MNSERDNFKRDFDYRLSEIGNSMAGAVTINDVEEAQRRIAGRVVRTAIRRSEALSDRAGFPVFLKLENRQATGSFKLRGACNALLCLDDAARAAGLVTASTGNHGRAVAYAAGLEGARATICLSTLVPANKVDEIRRLGAKVNIVGRSQDDAMLEVERLVAKERMSFIPPFDDRDVIAGQGTIGLEILDELPEIGLVLVPLSGGGLASGVALALKARRPGVRVVGISMERGAAMAKSLSAGHPVEIDELDTLADSLGGGIGLDNRWTFRMCRDLLDDVVLLSEAEIAAGIRHAFEVEGEIVEGAGAVGISALLADRIKPAGPVAVILSGGNIDMALHQAIVDGPEAETA